MFWHVGTDAFAVLRRFFARGRSGTDALLAFASQSVVVVGLGRLGWAGFVLPICSGGLSGAEVIALVDSGWCLSRVAGEGRGVEWYRRVGSSLGIWLSGLVAWFSTASSCLRLQRSRCGLFERLVAKIVVPGL